jgi:protein TonB
MRRDWKLSIIGAVAFHLAALFGFQVTLNHAARLVQDSAVEVTLVAAPAPVASVVKTALPVEIPKPIPPEEVISKPPEPTPEPIPIPEVVVKAPDPTPEPVPTPSIKPVTAVSSTPRPTPVIGDGGSPQSGLDATTQKAQVGVRAEPNYLKNPEPPYPLAARRRRETGMVLLTVKVTAQGRAAKVELKQSSGHPLLDEAALQAVRSWEFQPARIGSMAVESEIEVPVRFKLTD